MTKYSPLPLSSFRKTCGLLILGLSNLIVLQLFAWRKPTMKSRWSTNPLTNELVNPFRNHKLITFFTVLLCPHTLFQKSFFYTIHNNFIFLIMYRADLHTYGQMCWSFKKHGLCGNIKAVRIVKCIDIL